MTANEDRFLLAIRIGPSSTVGRQICLPRLIHGLALWGRTNVKTFHVVVLVLVMNMMAAAQQPSQSAPSDKVTAEQVNDANIQLMRQDIRAQRKKIVAANLPLTETEATKFWVVYDQYIAETITINDGRYALIKDYAKNYENMTDDQSDTFIERWLGFDNEDTQLRLRYVPEFQKVISHRKTAMFFQIDRRIGMMLNLQLAGQVPLVKP